MPPVVQPIDEFATNTTIPGHVAAVEELLTKAPPVEIPVPEIFNASLPPKLYPFKSKTAPDDTTTPVVDVFVCVPTGEFVPSPARPNFNVPALTVVAPVKVFKAFKIKAPVPEPTFVTVDEPLTTPVKVKSPLPVTPIFAEVVTEIAPLNVADVVDEFINVPKEETPTPVNVNPSAVPNVYPFTSNVPPVAIVVPPPVEPNGVFVALPAPPNFIIPAVIVVVPV